MPPKYEVCSCIRYRRLPPTAPVDGISQERGLCGAVLSLFISPRVIGPCQRGHRLRTDAVAAHMRLLGLGERLAIGAVTDDLDGREALSLARLGRFQHPQADIDDHLRRASHHRSDQGQRSGIVMAPLCRSRLRPIDSGAIKTLARCWRRIFSTLRF